MGEGGAAKGQAQTAPLNPDQEDTMPKELTDEEKHLIEGGPEHAAAHGKTAEYKALVEKVKGEKK